VKALKFLPSHTILPEGLSSPFIEYVSPRSTLAPPHPSPLASRLLNIDGITSVFYGPDFITVTKASDANWAHVKPEVFSLITEAVSSGEQIVNTVGNQSSEAGQEGGGQDTLGYSEEDNEVVGMIKELLETRIRPAIQEDGGDIEFRGFENGNVMLKLRGACRTCDSSTVTLRNGIESMLMHYVSLASLGRGVQVYWFQWLQIEEVKGVTQVLDQEEEIAMQEFAKFEEKLKQQKGPGAVASTIGKGSLDTAEAWLEPLCSRSWNKPKSSCMALVGGRKQNMIEWLSCRYLTSLRHQKGVFRSDGEGPSLSRKVTYTDER